MRSAAVVAIGIALGAAHVASAQVLPPPALAPAGVAVHLHAATLSPERAAAEEVCLARDPACDWMATLSKLERQSVERAIAARGYELEPSPWGKVIATVDVFNEDVFAERPAWLKFFNHFHVTTREAAIRDELTIGAGQTWDMAKAQESGRRLRDPLWSSVVVVLPVKSRTPGAVDLLVITRDIWSLRLNSNYTFQEGSLTNLAITLSENNFFGNRDVVAFGYAMDQGQVAIGPQFLDKNVDGSHLYVSASAQALFTRQLLLDDGRFNSEGSQSSFAVSRPLWSLASEWAAGASFSHVFGIQRQFIGTQLRGYQDPTTGDVLPWEYELHVLAANAYVTHQFGAAVKQQLSLGYSVNSQRPSLLGTFPGDDQDRADFVRDVLPRNEVTSVPYLEYSLFTPTYQTPRNLGTYELVEDVRTGPNLDVQLGFGLKVLGSDFNFERPIASAGYTLPWGRDGFTTLSTSLAMRFQDGTTIDNTAAGTLRVTSPSWSWGRVVLQSTLATRWHDTQNAFYAVGGDPSLRGFNINQFTGQRVELTQIEVRSKPIAWWVLRVGAVAFWDSGGAANSLAELTVHNDVGFGVRGLVPQTSRLLFRFDLAVPVDGPDPGVPHFIGGFDSAF